MCKPLLQQGENCSEGFCDLHLACVSGTCHVGIEGVSRYGKAALVTMAFDTRFALVLVGSSGEGGAKPHRRNFGDVQLRRRVAAAAPAGK